MKTDNEKMKGELLRPGGVYYLNCIGPKDSKRQSYLELLERMDTFLFEGLYDQAFKLKKVLEKMLEPKWEMEVHNLVTTAGLSDSQDKYFSGSGYTAAWYLFLMSGTGYTTGPNAADTAASHSGWTEELNYSQTARPTAVFGNSVSGVKSFSSPLVFSMNPVSQITVKGSGLISSSTKGGTTGVLYSVGASTQGDQTFNSGDTINATYTSTYA